MRPRLLQIVLGVLIIVAAIVAWWQLRESSGPKIGPGSMPPPIDTTVPITVSRSDSTLGLLRLGVVADGSGLLPGPIDLRAEPIANSAMLVTEIGRASCRGRV